MNWKAMMLCAVLFGTALTARALDPITCKEIAMLLRNGEKQPFIIQDTARRKLLQPLAPEEEKLLVSLGATPALMTTLHDPAMIATPQAAEDYKARVQQRLAGVQQDSLAAQQPNVRPGITNTQQLQQQQQLPQYQNTRPQSDDVSGKPLELKFTAADGTPVDLARLRGKVVLVDFWATWCHPCMGEVPNVVAAYKKYHSKGFEIIGISLDKDKDKMIQVTREMEMVWPQFFDGKGWGNEISTRYHIHGIPTMWLVNKQGIVASTQARGHLDAEIEKLLAE